MISSQSENFTLSVAVPPRAPVASQWCETFSMSGFSSAAGASYSARSSEKVFSAPRDLRIRLARTGRSSMPWVSNRVAIGLAEVGVHELECLLRMSMPGKIPRRFILALVAGPISWNFPAGRS